MRHIFIFRIRSRSRSRSGSSSRSRTRSGNRSKNRVVEVDVGVEVEVEVELELEVDVGVEVLLYFLFPSGFSMLSPSLKKLVTCGVIRSFNCNGWARAFFNGMDPFWGVIYYRTSLS